MVFLTGDLGFKALEPLRDAMGARFINAGVAEQNMISVAAGLAKMGLRPWAYSIAPFIYARPFEQVRNDICLHGLPVVLIGNGGGYGYGVMGGTHHALEDYGCLLTLPGMRVFVPAFDEDVAAMIPLLLNIETPAYLRLGVSEAPCGWTPPIYTSWRQLLRGTGSTIVATGPLVGGVLAAASQLPEIVRPELWVVSELPIEVLPQEFIESVRRSGHLLVVEEHTSAGGIGQMLAYRLAEMGESPKRFSHRFALGCAYGGRYGSQRFHRVQSGLDPSSVLSSIASE